MKPVHCLVLIAVCATASTTVSGNVTQHISDATTQFSLNLLKAVLHNQPGNAIVSPVSVYTLLAMLQQGARSNSETELNNVLHALPNETKEGYHDLIPRYQQSDFLTTLEFASKAFVKTGYNIEPDYKQSLISDFLSDTSNVDFTDSTAASEQINSWVAEHTHNRITQLFTPGDIPSDAVLILTNAIYFMSYWDHPFWGPITNKAFSPTPTEEKQVPTMYQIEYYQGGIDSELGAKWVHLEFEDGPGYTVLLVLPTERHGLDNLVNRFTPENLTALLSTTVYKHVTLSLPKFRLNTDTQLIPILQQLGVHDIFGDTADFSGISTQRIKVTKIVQKAEIAADENGVTASAATGAIGQPMSGHFVQNADELIFTADEPFLFFIVDRQNYVPLFAGRVSDPSNS